MESECGLRSGTVTTTTSKLIYFRLTNTSGRLAVAGHGHRPFYYFLFPAMQTASDYRAGRLLTSLCSRGHGPICRTASRFSFFVSKIFRFPYPLSLYLDNIGYASDKPSNKFGFSSRLSLYLDNIRCVSAEPKVNFGSAFDFHYICSCELT